MSRAAAASRSTARIVPTSKISSTKPSGASPSNGPETQATFPVRLRIFTEDRPGMLAGITAVISETGANIRTFESGGEDNTRARIEVALDVRDRKQLEQILSGIKRIPGVFDIERVYNV